MAVLEHLEPKLVFRYFEELCAIPHGSGHTKAISDYLVNFARKRGLAYHQDALGNVIIIKPATAGYENAEPVIVQGHMDMVCEKTAACRKDMSCEGLDLVCEGDVIYAKDTTLGGDDGIAVAMALALMDSADVAHPRLEAVFTVDEEVGMLGADGIDVMPLQGHTMINIDSEVEGVFTVSCAGGNNSRCVLPIEREDFESDYCRIEISGLIGGHSGVEIHKGRANADMLMGRVLYRAAKEIPLRLVSVAGGLKDNAIPVSCTAHVAGDMTAVEKICRAMEMAFRNEYRTTDPDITVTMTVAESAQPMDAESTQKAITLLTCLPNGIYAMSADIEGLVQTSLNLGVLTTTAEELSAAYCVRSSVESQKEMLVDRLRCLTEQLGGKLVTTGDYPGWQYRQDSPLRDLMARVFTEQYGKPPVVEAIHAGVECGLFAGKIADLDCVSIGPDLTDIHTPREKMYISSVQRVWQMLVEVLRLMK